MYVTNCVVTIINTILIYKCNSKPSKHSFTFSFSDNQHDEETDGNECSCRRYNQNPFIVVIGGVVLNQVMFLLFCNWMGCRY